jgi:uncharacterized damage-inducible protein DinB
MLSTEEARELLAYDAWANDRMALVIERARSLAPKIRRTWAHVAAALELWFARCAGEDYEHIVVWPDLEAREASERVRAANGRWSELLTRSNDSDLRRRVTFTNTRGEACADPLGDIVRHLVNHGTHHRAQIAMLLRESGIEPENLDYIIYCRARSPRTP